MTRQNCWRLLRLLPVAVLGFIVGYCNPPAQAPAPSKPAAPVSVSQPQSPSTLSLPLDVTTCNPKALTTQGLDIGGCWYLDHVMLGGTTVAGRLPLTQPSDCPRGVLCVPIPSRDTNLFASYLLHVIPPVYSTTVATPTASFFDISGYRSIQVHIRVVASPTAKFLFDSEPGNRGTTPARLRLYLMHYEGAAQSTGPHWRFYSHDPAAVNPTDPDRYAYTLASGEVTLAVPLDPADWVSVYPHQDAAADAAGWQKVMRGVGEVGIVAGGGWSYSHGIAVTGGPAELQVTSYQLTR